MNLAERGHHVLVGHGDHPIPTEGWGAVENIIWQLSSRLRKRGIQVTIVNRRRYRATLEVLLLSLRGQVDFVYCHSEKPIPMLAVIAKWRNFRLISTSHSPLAPSRLTTSELKALRRCKCAAYHLVLREDIKDMITSRNPLAKCAVQFNATETSEFRTNERGNGRALCIGRIQARKRQNETALLFEESGIECDFVGPIMDDLVINESLQKRHIGTWDRETVHNKLCDYSCLVLLSESEGQPLVVIEALAAGIPVVVSRDAAWNLDLDKPYTTVTKCDEDVIEAVRIAIANRDRYTKEIRQYALNTFDYERLVDNYLDQLNQWVLAETVH